MSQDKSREFLHSGNAKDKFKFFFKATLLHHVDDLLKSIEKQLNGTQELVGNLENSIRPILKEFSELQGNIKSMEQVEEISQRVQLLKKKLAWAHVYDIDDQIQQAQARIEKLKGHIPYCEDLIARQTATKERSELEQDCIRRVNEIKRIMKRAEMLEQQIHDTSDQDDKHTQAEEHEMEENLSELKKEVEEAVLQFERYKKDEDSLSNSIANADDDIQKVQSEIEVLLKKDQQNRSSIRDLRLHQTNKVTAFGGNRVTNLLRAIERHHYRFGKPPIGPIGAHLKLVGGDKWAFAVENAVGRLFNAFIVNDHKDNLVLRACARHDFSRSRLNIPDHMLPQINHPTTMRISLIKKILKRQKSFGNHSTGSRLTLDDLLEKLRNSHASSSYALLKSHSGYPKEQHMVSSTPTVPITFSNQFPLDILTKRMLKQCDSSNEKLRNSHASSSYSFGFYALLESHSAGYSNPIAALPVTSREDKLYECWESSYIADVLKESGFYDVDTDMLMATRSSPNFFMGYFVFQNLEKTYCGKLAFLKNEMKLLFDHINKALSEINNQV
ncbi:hypothetical protein POM88_000084 [Heracleum sosnowskyi]|uniref:DUF4378 domain-containing protein n=1 Tax=Heracleum sosnowskyi TaxID=360622 RepID=A0AAD8JAI9_9APIA|nr:hypothetical protein POM88_000084 [Heracleum sosnowskyi]